EIIFASPKVNPSILQGVLPCLEDAQRITDGMGYRFKFRLFANDDFNSKVLQPILKVSGGVSDTNELFIRGYHMLQMFDKADEITEGLDSDGYGELKIGKLAQLVMRPILESGIISEEELKLLQDKEYCKKIFDLSFPLLVKSDGKFDKVRYYKDPLTINGLKYMMCSQWAEGKANNDRPFLEKWIQEHQHLSQIKDRVPKGKNLTFEEYVRENCCYGVEYLGSVGLCEYYLKNYPGDEDVGIPLVIMVYGNEFVFCEQDMTFAVLGLFDGTATVDIDDPKSTGIWKRIFNVSETELLKAVETVGNSAVDLKEYL
ncbi:MAG: DUF3606 domain-containing protein, partial [Acetatifactor sp.]|nr:DUF3606 domain-containing protein [Acetatifactor sp.]